MLAVDFEAPFDEEHEFAPRGPAETDVFPEATVRVALSLQSYAGGVARHAAPSRRPGTGSAGAARRRCWAWPTSRCASDSWTSAGPGDDEAYPLEHDFVDLAPLARDAILLDLPLAPLCREDCKGLCPYCGIDRNEETCACTAAPRSALGYTGRTPIRGRRARATQN